MTSPTAVMHDVFVSHADADRAWVEGYLLDSLRAAGLTCISQATFTLGMPTLLQLEQAVQHSSWTVLVVSTASQADGYNQFASVLAQSFGAEQGLWPVIVLVLHPVKLPPGLAILPKLDATDPATHPAVIARLCEELGRPAPGPLAPLPCPYPGIRPFDESQSDRFFGRDNEVQHLLLRLRRQPFLTIIGPSGSGKSSLVFAGMLPVLRQSTLFGDGHWLVRSVRPGPTPLTELRRVLGDALADPAATVDRLLRAETGATRLLLIVDQFEEIFAVAGDEAAAFQEMLKALEAVPACWLVLTARADFYPELMASPLWPVVQANRVEVLPLNDNGLREAIVRPAEAVGVYVEAALVERLVADAAGEPGSLPLVQETLVLLWQHLRRRFLPLAAYQALVDSYQAGAPAGGTPRTALQVAMAEQANRTFAALSPDQQVIARRVFLRLVQFGEGRSDTRRQQRVDQLTTTSGDAAALQSTLDTLANRRLLTVGGEERQVDRAVDIAHEALISGWPTLGLWLEERREAELTRRRLVEKAEEWERLGRGDGGLLDAIELQEAERWLARPDAEELGYDEALTALLAASRTALETAAREREDARQRVADALRLRAEEQQARAEEQTRAATKFRTVAAVAGVVAVLAIGAAVFAIEQSQVANQRRLGSIVLALAAEAPQQQFQLSEHERGVLLALQAYHFNQRIGNQMLAQVDAGLRAVLSAPFFGIGLTGERQNARVAALSPDGALVATGGLDGSIWLRRLAAWHDPIKLVGDSTEITALAFDQGGRWLIVRDKSGRVRRWEVAQPDAAPALVANVGADTIASALSLDGRWLAVKAADGGTRLWDLSQSANPALRVTLPEKDPKGWRALAFSPDGQRLATVNREGQVSVWATAQPEAVPLVLGDKLDKPQALAFSPDGLQLAAGGENGQVWWWSALRPNAPPRQLVGAGDHVYSLAFSPNGQWLAAGSEDWRVRLWTLSAPDDEPAYLTGHLRWVKAVAFTPDNQTLVSASPDEVVRLWRLSQPGETAPLLAAIAGTDGDGFKALSFSPTARLLAAGNQDWTVRVWNLDQPHAPPVVLGGRVQWKRPAEPLGGPRHWTWTVAFSPDGRWLASGSEDGAVRLWEVAALRESGIAPRRELRGNTGAVRSVAFSHDSRWLAAGGGDENSDGRDNPVLVWAVDGGDQPVHRLDGHTKVVESVAFSPRTDGLLAWASQDGSVRLRRLGAPGAAPAPVAVLDRLEPGTRTLAFSHDGQVLASGSGQTEASGIQPGIVHLWTVSASDAAPVERGRLKVLGGGAHALSFYPTDSDRLATSSVDGTVRLWRVSQPDAPPMTLYGHERLVRAVAFSADGLLASGGADDNTIRLWSTTDRLAKLACERVRRNLTLDEWHRFIGRDIPYEPTCAQHPPGDVKRPA